MTIADARDDANEHDTGPVLVPAQSSLQEQRPLTLKHGDTFAVYDQNGDILAGPGSPEGLFHADMRHLSHLTLSINGASAIVPPYTAPQKVIDARRPLNPMLNPALPGEGIDG